MTKKTINVTSELYEYLLKNSLREDAVLKQLRDKTQTMSMSQMQIAPDQGQFMQLLIKLLGAKKTLDIGTFTGYSALAVALALPEDGKVIACDINGEWTTVAKRFWQQSNVGHKIELRLAPAAETLQNLLDQGEAGTFDFAFIDADKVNYPDYYEKSLALLRRGGLIAIDNVFQEGGVADPDVVEKNVVAIRNLNKQILNDPRVMISMLSIADGLTLALKN